MSETHVVPVRTDLPGLSLLAGRGQVREGRGPQAALCSSPALCLLPEPQQSSGKEGPPAAGCQAGVAPKAHPGTHEAGSFQGPSVPLETGLQHKPSPPLDNLQPKGPLARIPGEAGREPQRTWKAVSFCVDEPIFIFPQFPDGERDQVGVGVQGGGTGVAVRATGAPAASSPGHWEDRGNAE